MQAGGLVKIFTNISKKILGSGLGVYDTFFIHNDKNKQKYTTSWQFSWLYMLNACGSGTNHKQNI